MKPICLTDHFTDFFKNDYIYVDKTERIFNLVEHQERVFISRTHGYGKTLILDTIATLFEKGIDPYFKGTWIYKEWKDTFYPVLRLNFKKYSLTDLDKFMQELVSDITAFAKENGVKAYHEDKSPRTSMKRLLDSLNDAERRVVILIDDYDHQLKANINNEDFYNKLNEILRCFYAVIKDHGAIRFLCLTSFYKFREDPYLNDVVSDILDISKDSFYSELFGFSRDEIKKYYIDYLKLAASKKFQCPIDDVTDEQIDLTLEKIAVFCGECSFDKFKEKKVCCPLSINLFLANLVE